ncbi:MAG: DUF937 domain-containing protein [Woeseiaceae bacterium]
MDLKDLIDMAGGGSSVGQMAGSIGIDSSAAADLIGALSPALMKGVQKQSEASGGMDLLDGILQGGAHQKYIDQPELMQASATRDDGNSILGHLFGSKDVSREVAAQAAAKTGLDSSVVKQALPLIAGMAMAAMSKQSTNSDSGGLGGLLGSLTGGDDDTGLDDLIGMAKKFL